ncbi:MAG: tetratricopeptide repeat protein, partial [Gammaproteobacteria bacterium]
RNAIDLARNNGLMVEDQESPAIPRGMSAKPDVRESSATPTLASTRQNLAIGAMDQARVDLEVLASRGDSEAQFLLSEMLATLRVDATAQDQALLWLQRSALGGYADAQFKLAGLYLRGEQLPNDEAEAVTWLRAAARQGHDGARQKLDTIYRDAGLNAPGP